MGKDVPEGGRQPRENVAAMFIPILLEWKYRWLESRVESDLRRVNKDRKRLGVTLSRLNRHLIRAMQSDERSNWESRRKLLQEAFDPLLGRIEEETGWRFPYGAESRNEHRYAEHRYESEPKGKSWAQ